MSKGATLFHPTLLGQGVLRISCSKTGKIAIAEADATVWTVRRSYGMSASRQGRLPKVSDKTHRVPSMVSPLPPVEIYRLAGERLAELPSRWTP